MTLDFDVNKPALKLYGERNTGTKYVTRLIRRHLDIELLPGIFCKSWRHAADEGKIQAIARRENLPDLEVAIDLYFAATFHHNLGWKHSLVRPVDCLQTYEICSTNLSFLTITKNPYAWLLSLYRRPYHQYWRQTPEFTVFLTSPWRTLGRENAPQEFPNPVELWNAKNASYIQLKKQFPALNLKYEDVLFDPKSAVESIQEMSSCKWRRQPFHNANPLSGSRYRDFLFYRTYYLEEQWKQALSSNEIGLINERLNGDLLAYFQYERLA